MLPSWSPSRYGFNIPSPEIGPLVLADLWPGITAQVGLDVVSISRPAGAANPRQGSISGQTVHIYESANIVDVVRSTADGVQMLAVLASDAAPSTLEYEFGPGTKLDLLDDGSVLVTMHGRYAGQVAAPWAVDADGTSLVTHYRVKGSNLIQTVDTTGAVFPVVADPYITFGWSVYVTFRHSETHTIYNTIKNMSTTVAIGWLCARIPHTVLAVGCALMFVWMYNSIKSTFQSASAQHTCVRFAFSYSALVVPLPPSSWYVYNCGS